MRGLTHDAGLPPETGAERPRGGARLRVGPQPAEEPREAADHLPPAIVQPRYAPGWDITGCLWRRKWLIAGVTALSMAGLTALIAFYPESFTASTSLIYEGDHQVAARGTDALKDPDFAPDTLASEVERVLSEDSLAAVAGQLHLADDPGFGGPPRGSWVARASALLPDAIRQFLPVLEPPPPDAARVVAQTVAALRERLTVGPVGQSRVLRISAQAREPELAARIANTVASVYVVSLLKAKESATVEAHEWLDRHLAELRERSTQSALAYEQFRQASGLVRGKDSTILQEQITQVSSELFKAQELRVSTELALSQIGSTPAADLDQLGVATGSPLLAKLREQAAQAAGHLAEMEVNGGPSLPRVVAARAQVQQLSRAIGQERERIRQTLQKRASLALASEQRLGATLADLKGKIDAFETNNAKAQALERDASADRDLYTSFLTRSRQTDPELSYQSPSARVLSRASVPVHPSAPNRKMLLPAALVVSLGLGVVAGFVRDSPRRGIYSLRDLPCRPELRLGLLPLVPRRSERMARVFDEAVAQILSRVLLTKGGPSPATIVVTSALPREGKTRTAIALAKVAKDRGLRVLMVDGDLRTRGMSGAAGLMTSERTLVRLLRDEIPADEAEIFNCIWGLSILPAGSIEGSPMRLLGTGAWDMALRELKANYDLVIIDTPPVLAAGDTWLLARPADATIVVARWGVTPPSAVELALEQLATTKSGVSGVVLTMVSHREHASYGYDDSVLFSPKLLRYHGQDASA